MVDAAECKAKEEAFSFDAEEVKYLVHLLDERTKVGEDHDDHSALDEGSQSQVSSIDRLVVFVGFEVETEEAEVAPASCTFPNLGVVEDQHPLLGKGERLGCCWVLTGEVSARS